uniref:Uncharacterized protein n=1 Tax=Helianthus annuus TaxID=4232 RepID=A0A251SG99_HELAN
MSTYTRMNLGHFLSQIQINHKIIAKFTSRTKPIPSSLPSQPLHFNITHTHKHSFAGPASGRTRTGITPEPSEAHRSLLFAGGLLILVLVRFKKGDDRSLPEPTG